jgi:hypothetical protein
MTKLQRTILSPVFGNGQSLRSITKRVTQNLLIVFPKQTFSSGKSPVYLSTNQSKAHRQPSAVERATDSAVQMGNSQAHTHLSRKVLLATPKTVEPAEALVAAVASTVVVVAALTAVEPAVAVVAVGVLVVAPAEELVAGLVWGMVGSATQS